MNEGDTIAGLVIGQYRKLPKKGKPLVRSNGVREWTILAGIVISNKASGKLECVSVATGVKALPDERIKESRGTILHDCHAEVLAIRAFNHYVMTEGVDHIQHVYLYVSAPPCGDASMGLINGEDEWTRTPKPEPGALIRGRAHYNCVGHIRTKPGRGDSIATMSKSCSDKLCLRQSRGILLSPVRHIHKAPLFLTGIVTPRIPYADFERCFSRWSPVQRFDSLDTAIEFEDYHPQEGAPSPCSIIWTPGVSEIIANGIIQGSKGKPSAVSRSRLTQMACSKAPASFETVVHYYDLKTRNNWPPGWIRTAHDDFEVASLAET